MMVYSTLQEKCLETNF